METKYIKTTDLQVGNIVHFYGARFEVLEVQMNQPHSTDKIQKPFLSSKAKWIDGVQVRGYFGEGTIDWNFQGNDQAGVTIEIQGVLK